MEIAFFDFCGTLAKINTLSCFVSFVINCPQVKRRSLRKVLFCSRTILSILRIPGSRELELKCLRGIDKVLLDCLARRFYDDVIVNSFNESLVAQLKQLKNQGYKIIILSAALEIYLRFITESLPVDFVVSTQLSYDKKAKCLGRVHGIDTIGIGKIEKLKEGFNNYEKINFSGSYFFSDDGVSDGPILNIVGKPVLV